jgi:hypothetical protein
MPGNYPLPVASRPALVGYGTALLKLCVAHLESAPKGVVAYAKVDDTAILPLFFLGRHRSLCLATNNRLMHCSA